MDARCGRVQCYARCGRVWMQDAVVSISNGERTDAVGSGTQLSRTVGERQRTVSVSLTVSNRGQERERERDRDRERAHNTDVDVLGEEMKAGSFREERA